MTKTAKLTIGVGALVILAGLAGYYFFPRDPFVESGQSWKNETPHDWEVLRLLDSGRYVARVWCDVCGVQVISGSWSRSGNVVVLRPDHGRGARRELIEIGSNGCRLLVHPKGIYPSGIVNPLMAYLREGEPCEVRWVGEGYVRKL
jgi:hypothetical protein